MSIERGDDLSQMSMLDLFRMEAAGQAQALTSGLLELERGAEAPAIEPMMRAAHSLKGAAAIVGLDIVVQLAHAMEDVFIAVGNGALQLDGAAIDQLLGAVDLIVQLSEQSAEASEPWLAQNRARLNSAMKSLGLIARGRPAPARTAPAPEAQAALPAAPIAAQPPARAAGQPGFDRLLSMANQSRLQANQVGNFIAAMQRCKRGQVQLFQAIELLHENLLKKGDSSLLDQSTAVLEKTRPLRQIVQEQLADIESYERRALSVSSALLDEVLSLRMRPLREGLQAFPRMVRDLARSLGKEAQLRLSGEATLVDRSTLAAIESPLNHMLRNAVDHGIETPAERRAAGKPELGTVTLEARHRSGMLVLVISDDGRGVDPERIRRKVVERRLASADMAAAMSNAELLEFLFLPAFSLKESASAISGRGVGLDVVQQAVRDQNGSVHLECPPGEGLRTTITLPLTQSTVRTLVFDVLGEAYAMPIARIERVCMVAPDAIHSLEGKQFFEHGGEHLGLVAAAQVLALGQARAAETDLAVLVIGSAERRYALVVDAIRGEQSLAVQPLDTVFGKMRDISAGALLDDGTPVLLLDVPDLLLSIDKLLHEGALEQLAPSARENAVRRRRVLVVDDSLTVREMERKLLQARGYQVDIAIDGMDGWNMVRATDYDLLVTDIDMPRMDGIELVKLVRADTRLSRLPVMIVSYKDRAEDRARGLAAGADYYLAKGSFHDATLLDAVRDLIGEALQ
jgi:two-component system sensor histidine kinase and response regulator WspE